MALPRPSTFYDLGRLQPGNNDEPASITPLALRTSRAANGVSRRHGEVARAMWHPLWPDRPVDQVPIGHVTNGVHTLTWMSRPIQTLLERHFGPLNGGLNLSVLDGWWIEGYDGQNGWAIESPQADPAVQDDHDATALLDVLEREVIPEFYDRGDDQLPHRWLQRVKAAMRTLIPRLPPRAWSTSTCSACTCLRPEDAEGSLRPACRDVTLRRHSRWNTPSACRMRYS